MENKPKWQQFFIKYWLPIISFVFGYSLTFYISNLFLQIVYVYKQSYVVEGTFLKPAPLEYSSSMLTDFSSFFANGTILLIVLVISFLAASFLAYKMQSNYGRIGEDEKGTGRFTTEKELVKQYRAVPDREKRFTGGGGVPISRIGDKILIDDSPVNNLIIGTTRSGKGETVVIQAIDIYSRAEQQASLIINDPKGELFAASKEQLESLNYNVQVLNLMNPFQSMSYNLLQLVIEEIKNNDYAMAQQYARSIAFMIYNDPTAKDKFWQNASTDLCTALILGLCEKCRDTPEKIVMYNIAVMMTDLATQIFVDDDTGVEKDGLDKFFETFDSTHPARLQYATLAFAKAQTRAAVLSNTASKLGIFTLDGIAKMTAKNSFDMRKIGFGKWVTVRVKPLTRVDFKVGNERESIRSSSNGIASIYYKNDLQIGDEVTIQCEDEKVSYSLCEIDRDGYITFEQTSAESHSIELLEWVQDGRPVAVFMITPDYDQTFNIIASLFIKQVYTVLARTASNVKGNKCHREVVFELDEFGNMPAIEGMANILTVCLGRNIRFNLFVQAYSQIEELYGSNWKTIDGNCNNTIYLLTSDTDTAERISKALGPKTINTKSRSGKTFDFNKSKTVGIEARSLLDANELMRLKEGESVVIRTIKRQDNKRNRIKQFPIYNTGPNTLKYRWEYIGDIFDTTRSLNDFDITCIHASLDLNDLILDFSEVIDNDSLAEDTDEAILSEKVAQPKTEEDDSEISFENTAVYNNGLNLLFFKTAFKNLAMFEEVFGDRFNEIPINEVRDLIIAYQDDIDPNSFLQLENMLNKRLEEGVV